jgi:hypothetical protein
MPAENIDSIKRRMIRNASKIWGFPDVQDINSFDPVLGLIMGALAEEIYNISNEINKADARVVDKLLEVLFSRNLFTHFPAHAVAQAKPLQGRVKLTDFYRFFYTKEEYGKDSDEGKTLKKNLYFSPTFHSILMSGEMRYLFAGKYLYEIDGRYKEMTEELPTETTGGKNKLLLGIKLHPSVDVLDGLSLFFSFKNIREDNRFFHALQAAEWKINGNKVNFYRGLGNPDVDSVNAVTNLLKQEKDITFKTCSFINDFYSNRFMTLDSAGYRRENFVTGNFTPESIKANFEEKYPELLSDDIFWIEINLAQPLSFEELNDIMISMNAFPVMNRELNEFTHSVSKGTNVIPLLTNDLFFDVRKVTDSANAVFTPRNSVDTNGDGNKTYFIRQGGVARFDSSDARESIKHLIDLVRDESAAFSVKGADLIALELKELDQIIMRLQQRIQISDSARDLNSYLLLDSESDFEKIQVQFWSIAGEKANNIRPGSKLAVFSGNDLDDRNVSLITPTFGGRQKLSREDKLNTLRRSLLSRGRIVTTEDMKALGYEILGDDLARIEVKKGVSLEHSPGKGMCRTIDIYLFLKEGNELTPEEIWHKTENMKVRLRRESVNLLPYRIFVK